MWWWWCACVCLFVCVWLCMCVFEALKLVFIPAHRASSLSWPRGTIFSSFLVHLSDHILTDTLTHIIVWSISVSRLCHYFLCFPFSATLITNAAKQPQINSAAPGLSSHLLIGGEVRRIWAVILFLVSGGSCRHVSVMCNTVPVSLT